MPPLAIAPGLVVEVMHTQRLVAEAIGWALARQETFEAGSGSPTPRLPCRIVITNHSCALDTPTHQEDRRIIVLADAARETEVQRAMQRGAYGYLVLNSPLSEVNECVRRVASGARYVCPEAAARIASSFGRTDLTPREIEVLELMASGLSNKLIAERLTVSEGTVKSHVRSIFGKLGTESRTQAARVAQERGIVSPI